MNRNMDPRTRSSLILRGVICVYLIYLGYTLIRDAEGNGTLPPWAGVLIGVVFILIALAVGGLTIYTQIKKQSGKDQDRQEPEIPDKEAEETEN